MRKLSDHIVDGDSANHQLTITVTDEAGQGGANHAYVVEHPGERDKAGYHVAGSGLLAVAINFQNGPIKEFGVNGVTQEALLAIVIDRLRSFQAGPYACEDNAQALDACRYALKRLQVRTCERIARGVEGTNQK